MLKVHNSITKVLIILAGAFLIASCAQKEKEYQLSSPDKNIRMNFSLKEGKPQYSIQYKGDTVVLPSRLGIDLDKGIQSGSNFQVTNTSKQSTDDTWEPVWGIRNNYRNHYNELKVTLQQTESPSLELNLIFRAYDDGLALRYHLPEQSNLSDFTITSEQTHIQFPEDHSCFAHPRSGYSGNYENTFDPGSLSKITSESLIGLPLLVEANNCWISVMEADLSDYSGMSLSGVSGGSNELVSKLAPSEQDESVKVSGTTPHSSPWRVFMIGDQAGQFIESPLVYNLNDPGKLEDVSWIQPGKVVWPWWSGRVATGKPFSGEPNTALMKYYTDFAVRHNIPYLLVDAGWYSMEGDAWDQPEKENILTMEETRKDDYDIREVINYANEQEIKVLLWMHLGSMMTKEKVDKIFSTVADWGATGIKVDYFGGESQDLVNHLHYIFEKAAEHELLIDYHGAYKPTGVHRTYPNFMTSEAVKGLEYSKGNPEPKPKHNVTIPYTRMLGGPMDYTSGAFDLDGTEDHPKHVQTTRAHQMAMYAVYFSPLQMLVDYPGAYESAPDQFEFIKQVPVTWDDTRFLQGEPGEYVAVARKKGDDWFVGVMNNEQSDRQVNITLNFLDEGTDYTAHIYRDADDADQNPENVTVEEQTVTAGDEHSVTLASGGGEAIWIEAE